MSNLVPLVFIAAAAICVWNIANGLRTGRMHFGLETLSANAKRSDDPRGFWIYGALNVASIIIAIVGLMRTLPH